VQAAKRSDKMQYNGLIGTIQSILKQEGVLGFFSGLRTKVAQSVLSAALMFLLKERLYDISALSLQKLQPAGLRPVAPRQLGSV
jgi:solute carrier family 25 (peroxisomal adenine nucleotide transporter), member 17